MSTFINNARKNTVYTQKIKTYPSFDQSKGISYFKKLVNDENSQLRINSIIKSSRDKNIARENIIYDFYCKIEKDYIDASFNDPRNNFVKTIKGRDEAKFFDKVFMNLNDVNNRLTPEELYLLFGSMYTRSEEQIGDTQKFKITYSSIDEIKDHRVLDILAKIDVSKESFIKLSNRIFPSRANPRHDNITTDFFKTVDMLNRKALLNNPITLESCKEKYDSTIDKHYEVIKNSDFYKNLQYPLTKEDLKVLLLDLPNITDPHLKKIKQYHKDIRRILSDIKKELNTNGGVLAPMEVGGRYYSSYGLSNQRTNSPSPIYYDKNPITTMLYEANDIIKDVLDGDEKNKGEEISKYLSDRVNSFVDLTTKSEYSLDSDDNNEVRYDETFTKNITENILSLREEYNANTETIMRHALNENVFNRKKLKSDFFDNGRLDYFKYDIFLNNVITNINRSLSNYARGSLNMLGIHRIKSAIRSRVDFTSRSILKGKRFKNNPISTEMRALESFDVSKEDVDRAIIQELKSVGIVSNGIDINSQIGITVNDVIPLELIKETDIAKRDLGNILENINHNFLNLGFDQIKKERYITAIKILNDENVKSTNDQLATSINEYKNIAIRFDHAFGEVLSDPKNIDGILDLIKHYNLIFKELNNTHLNTKMISESYNFIKDHDMITSSLKERDLGYVKDVIKDVVKISSKNQKNFESFLSDITPDTNFRKIIESDFAELLGKMFILKAVLIKKSKELPLERLREDYLSSVKCPVLKKNKLRDNLISYENLIKIRKMSKKPIELVPYSRSKFNYLLKEEPLSQERLLATSLSKHLNKKINTIMSEIRQNGKHSEELLYKFSLGFIGCTLKEVMCARYKKEVKKQAELDQIDRMIEEDLSKAKEVMFTDNKRIKKATIEDIDF